MPYMYSIADETGIDVQSCFAAALGELVYIVECREEVEVSELPAALAPQPVVGRFAPGAAGAVPEWGGRPNERLAFVTWI
jgi:hypothetical protein